MSRAGSPLASRRLRVPPVGVRATHDAVEELLGTGDASLLDIVDNVLNKGVVLTGDITIALAQVDLIYARLSLLLCAADRVLEAGGPRRPSRRASLARRAGTAPRT